MFKMFKKEVGLTDSETKDLLQKLGDALTVMTKIDDEQQRQIAELKRTISHEREIRTRTELSEIRRLKKDNLDLTNENHKLQKKLDKLLKDNLPKEFDQRICGDHLPIRAYNVLKNNYWETYTDILDVTENDLIRTPNMGKRTLKLLKEHLQYKFPDKYHKFAVFGSMQH